MFHTGKLDRLAYLKTCNLKMAPIFTPYILISDAFSSSMRQKLFQSQILPLCETVSAFNCKDYIFS